jgi:hypothetical protein
VQEYAVAAVDGFERSWAVFTQVVADLEGPGLGAVTHADLEEHLLKSSRELVRVLLQDHLDVRAAREVRVPGGVSGPDGLAHPRAEAGRTRRLVSVFGPVTVSRIVYRSPGLANVCPADGILNLPAGSSFSHGIRRLAVVESVRGSFAGASEAIERATGVWVATRQIRDLTQRAGVDAQAFYFARPPLEPAPQDILVMTT